ncbi:MAG: glycine cleavage system protein GcvH [Geothrix sp.]|uniref:glycine cleavage system protein GcvH n=1 Tax=Geothrix sp. TaxID=1962974 RepID=UPI00185AB13A|nr:glycine cleavage system protein GcvH [Geothrix sp.]NWJ39617.1 glycine cleavage system protein GcvH [Geothrix sp.]WIL22360.1 MAG: glycine cleavage system protein GcvH [Geothrix sp.]
MFPADLKYTKDHEWLKPAGDGTALVGITQYAQEALGDVVFVDLPEAGASFAEGEEFGTVESVKTVSELNMPTAGEVLEVNAALGDHPEAVNEDPYGKGWMVKVKLTGELAGLLDATAYAALVSAESH